MITHGRGKSKKYPQRTIISAIACLLTVFTSCFSSASAITVRGPVAHIPTTTIPHRETLYIPVAALARAYGLTLSEQEGSSFVFSSDDLRLAMQPGSRAVEINGEVVIMDSPIDWAEGMLIAPIYLAIMILPGRFPARGTELPPPGGRIRIMLDPGHGGIDPGAIGEEGLQEKDVVLEIARKVRDLLQAEGYEVFLTRTGDRFVSLKKRARQANRSRVDLFVSIHANAAFNHLARGTETFYYAPASDRLAWKTALLENAVLRLEAFADSPEYGNNNEGNGLSRGKDRLSENIRAAGCVQRRISPVTECEDRGIKAAEFYVLKYTRMPSILVETGFLSNSQERERLADGAYRVRMAKAIARGICDYCGGNSVAGKINNSSAKVDPGNFPSVAAESAYNMNGQSESNPGGKAPEKED